MRRSSLEWPGARPEAFESPTPDAQSDARLILVPLDSPSKKIAVYWAVYTHRSGQNEHTWGRVVGQRNKDHTNWSQKIEQRLYKLLLKIAQSSLNVIKPSRSVSARKTKKMHSNRGESAGVEFCRNRF